MITLRPWSYSSLNTFENCPKQYYHRYILKEREPDTEVSLHGQRVHKSLEDRVGEAKPLPVEYEAYEPLAASVANLKNREGVKVYTEFSFGVFKDLTPCDFW